MAALPRVSEAPSPLAAVAPRREHVDAIVGYAALRGAGAEMDADAAMGVRHDLTPALPR